MLTNPLASFGGFVCVCATCVDGCDARMMPWHVSHLLNTDRIDHVFPPHKKKQDVLRNECFKREQPVGEALRGLYRDEGLAFLHRYVC